MKLTLLATVALLTAFPAFAQPGVRVIDPYARVIGPSGAVYFRLTNHQGKDEALLSATSPDAGMVMLMESAADAKGVMQMKDMAAGFAIKPDADYVLGSAGGHVMLMDLTRKIKAGDTITLVLTFQNAGEVTVKIPVDNKRTADPGIGPTPNDAASAK